MMIVLPMPLSSAVSRRLRLDLDDLPVRVWRLIALGPFVGVASGSLSYLLQYWIDPKIVEQPIGQYVWVVLFNVLSWTSWLALVPVAWLLASRVRINAGRRLGPILFHVVASLAMAVLHCLVNAAFRVALLTISGQPSTAHHQITFSNELTFAMLFGFEWEVLLYWGIVAAQHAMRSSRELRQREVQEVRLQARLVEARLDALQRQLHPHFIFNTLHAVAALLHRDPDGAESMLVRLGDLLRAVFRSQAQQEVPLGREIELLQQYLDIQQMRFGATLDAEIDVAPALRVTLVPVLLLQPLVENAIKHGFAQRAGGGRIRVMARRHDDWLELSVADNGRGASGRELQHLNEGVGLSNTRARLEHLYPGHHTVSVSSPAGGGFIVVLTLPWQAPAIQPADTADVLGIPA
jgi:two-component system, LytTR family, sensor kinase